MTTPLIILALLTLPTVLLAPFIKPLHRRARIGLAAVFLFTGAGHFLAPTSMALLIPPFIPFRVPLIYATGVVELAAAAALLIPRLAGPAGWLIILMLISLLPFNIYGAINRVPFGGHQWGPIYLLVRIPLQLILIAWTYHFAAAPPPPPPPSRRATSI